MAAAAATASPPNGSLARVTELLALTDHVLALRKAELAALQQQQGAVESLAAALNLLQPEQPPLRLEAACFAGHEKLPTLLDDAARTGTVMTSVPLHDALRAIDSASDFEAAFDAPRFAVVLPLLARWLEDGVSATDDGGSGAAGPAFTLLHEGVRVFGADVIAASRGEQRRAWRAVSATLHNVADVAAGAGAPGGAACPGGLDASLVVGFMQHVRAALA